MGNDDLLQLAFKVGDGLIEVFQSKYVELLKQYYWVGGMPEVVASFVKDGNYIQARKIQLEILNAYENDFSKHAPVSQLPRIRLVWQSIVGQLAKENSKFIYNVLRTGARAKDFELAIEWLKDAGLIHKVTRLSKSSLPLASYAEWSDFKIYLNDVGLLCAMGNLAPEVVVKNDVLFNELKGTITEQFVLQQLISESVFPFYWSPDHAKAEVDFVIQIKNQIIPIEAKAAENLKAKSLRVYSEKFKPETCIRTSMAVYKKQDWMQNIPLYQFLAWLQNLNDQAG